MNQLNCMQLASKKKTFLEIRKPKYYIVLFSQSEPYDELELEIDQDFAVLESNMLGPDNLRYAKEYRIYVRDRETELVVEPNFLGEGIWSDPSSSMEVNLIWTQPIRNTSPSV